MLLVLIVELSTSDIAFSAPSSTRGVDFYANMKNSLKTYSLPEDYVSRRRSSSGSPRISTDFAELQKKIHEEVKKIPILIHGVSQIHSTMGHEETHSHLNDSINVILKYVYAIDNKVSLLVKETFGNQLTETPLFNHPPSRPNDQPPPPERPQPPPPEPRGPPRSRRSVDAGQVSPDVNGVDEIYPVTTDPQDLALLKYMPVLVNIIGMIITVGIMIGLTWFIKKILDSFR